MSWLKDAFIKAVQDMQSENCRCAFVPEFDLTEVELPQPPEDTKKRFEEKYNMMIERD